MELETERLIRLYFDGSCGPKNPGGYVTAGCIIYDGKRKLTEISRFIGEGSEMSNNVGEYAGLNLGLWFLLDKGLQGRRIGIFGDSKIVVDGINGRKVSKGLCAPFSGECLYLLCHFTDWSATWIPREENGEADALSREAYYEMGNPLFRQYQSTVGYG